MQSEPKSPAVQYLTCSLKFNGSRSSVAVASRSACSYFPLWSMDCISDRNPESAIDQNKQIAEHVYMVPFIFTVIRVKLW